MPKETVMLTLDLKSLYTSIPLEDARQITENTLDITVVSKHPFISFLLELAEIILEKNYFRFNENFFYQLKG